jgi:hypothetical protein
MSWPVDGSTSGSFLWHSSCGAGPKEQRVALARLQVVRRQALVSAGSPPVGLGRAAVQAQRWPAGPRRRTPILAPLDPIGSGHHRGLFGHVAHADLDRGQEADDVARPVGRGALGCGGDGRGGRGEKQDGASKRRRGHEPACPA